MRLAVVLFVLVHLLALTSAAMTGFMGSAYSQAAERLQQLTAHLAPDSASLNLSQLTNRTARLVDAHKPQIVRLASQAGNVKKDYVVKHPVQSAFSVVTFFYPVGILRVVGYGPLGPYARMLSCSVKYLYHMVMMMANSQLDRLYCGMDPSLRGQSSCPKSASIFAERGNEWLWSVYGV